MRYFLVFSLFLATSLNQVPQVHASTRKCMDLVSSLLPVQKWREKITHANADKSFTDSSASREKAIRASVRDMDKTVLVDEATPVMDFHLSDNVSWDYIRQGGDYGTGIYPKIKVSGLGSSGQLPITLLLPVSGHTGAANARKWAKTDTYSILARSASGQTPLVDKKASLGVVTIQELIVPLKKNESLTIVYDRSGSAGPGGFPEGRYLEIVWDGT
jgi:hypothetical protein